MQYILTEEEYENLVPKNKYYSMIDNIEKLNSKVLQLAKNGKCDKEMGFYCDDCPISAFGTDTCFKIREYSK